jgi:hypothetical protein
MGRVRGVGGGQSKEQMTKLYKAKHSRNQSQITKDKIAKES